MVPWSRFGGKNDRSDWFGGAKRVIDRVRLAKGTKTTVTEISTLTANSTLTPLKLSQITLISGYSMPDI